MTQIRVASRYDLLDRPDRSKILGDRFLLTLVIVLTGYALDGRAWAYVGIPPVLYVGELTMLFGIVTLLCMRGWVRMFRTTQAIVLLPFMAWGFVRTIPYISVYLVDALRDGVIWGYATFAFAIAAVLMADPSRLNRLLRWYNLYAKIFVATMPFVWLISHVFAFAGMVPEWPWASVSIVTIKEGDALVHLGGIIAFWVSGLGPAVAWPWIALLTLNLGIMGVIDRGGLMAFMFVMAVCFLMRPRSIVPWRMFSMIGAMMFILAVTGISIDINGGKDRTISFSQVVENVSSILGSSKATGLDATKEWRKNWWNDIIGYTVHGPYFWGGKGFGINLADDDGYQVEADASLRSPHSIHFSMLARGGVPMAFLWALLLFTWGFGIAWGHLTAKRRGELRWASVFLFIGCYWAAFLINASFDVFLEGPMGGIWFWTVYGVGIACLYLYKNQPRALQY
jgi:hypothetical protein